MSTIGTREWWKTDRDVKRVCVAMLFALMCGFIVVTFSIDVTVRQPGPPAAAVTVTYAERDAMRWAALLWSGACFAVGSFIGFIFGIPRSLSSDTARTSLPPRNPDPNRPKGNPADPNDAATAARTPAQSQAPSQTSAPDGRGPSTAVNTNLEQISDWLTKIIVGVSLVNSEKIGTTLLRAADTMADSMGGGPERKSLALAILVYFGVIGLLGGYLLTRLFLQRAFDTAGAEAGRY